MPLIPGVFAYIPTCMSERTCAGAVFGSFKKYAVHFLNSAFGGTEPNKAPYTGIDKFKRLLISGVNRYDLRNNLRLDVELPKLSSQQHKS